MKVEFQIIDSITEVVSKNLTYLPQKNEVIVFENKRFKVYEIEHRFEKNVQRITIYLQEI